jgi:transposase
MPESFNLGQRLLGSILVARQGRIADLLSTSGKVRLMKLYRVKLTAEERSHLQELLSKGKAAARTLTHARILLKADEGVDGPRLTDDEIAQALDVNRSTVERVRIRCVEEGFDAALRPRPSRQLHPRKLDGLQEAHLVALTCSPAPKGRVRWSLRLLADKLVELEIVDDISYETVRQTLKKTHSSHG